MRDYLYIWNDPISHFIIASGLEFKDISRQVGLDGGIIILRTDAKCLPKYVEYDPDTRFDYIPCQYISRLNKQNIYHWGDFYWVDYAGDSFPTIPDHELAELLFFGQVARPLEKRVLSSLNNKFLCNSHDDGWYMRLYYSNWDHLVSLIGPLYPRLDMEDLKTGQNAYWITESSVELEERNGDPDIIMNRRRQSRSI